MLKIVQSSVQRRCHRNSTSFSFFWERIRLSLSTIHTAKRVIKMPCPKSPNITANRKGKVMMVYGARKKTEREPWATEKHGSPHVPLLSGLWDARERLLPPCWMNGLSLRERERSQWEPHPHWAADGLHSNNTSWLLHSLPPASGFYPGLGQLSPLRAATLSELLKPSSNKGKPGTTAKQVQ